MTPDASPSPSARPAAGSEPAAGSAPAVPGTPADALRVARLSMGWLNQRDRMRQKLIGLCLLVFGLLGWFVWVFVRPHMLAAMLYNLNYSAVTWTIDRESWTHGGSTQALWARGRSGPDDHELAHLHSLHWLEQIDLSGCRRVTDAGLVHLEGLPHLKRLALNAEAYWGALGGGPRITDAGLVHLRGLTGLRSLSLSGLPITDAGLVHLSGLSNLEQLDLSGTDIGDDGLVHLARLTRLKELSLRGTAVTSDGLKHLAGLTRLENLDLGKTSVDDSSVPILTAFPRLQRLEIEGTRITQAGWVVLLRTHPTQEVVLDAKVTDSLYPSAEGTLSEP